VKVGSEQLGRDPPALHSAERDQDGGDTDDLDRSGKSGGEPRRSGYTMILTEHY
jgi:hypothetical protein